MAPDGLITEKREEKRMERFLVASKNQDKIHEIREILEGFPFEIVGMESIGIHTDIVEDADSFEGNALIKASTIYKEVGGYVMADDSGLCIDALDGAPGIYSSRFCGVDSTYPEKFEKIWEMLKDVPKEKWTAHFVCAIAVVRPDGSHFVVKEQCDGVLLSEPRGENGFGYDPIFYVPEIGKTTAEISDEEKNAISHRGKALRSMLAILKQS